MIALALLLQASPAPPVLETLGRQQLPAHGCAAFLWTVGDGRLVAMASAEPAELRIALDGKPAIDLPRVARRGDEALGLTASGDYAAGGVTATLALTIATRGDLSDGAAVPQATLSVARPGQDSLVVPLAGLVGCAR